LIIIIVDNNIQYKISIYLLIYIILSTLFYSLFIYINPSFSHITFPFLISISLFSLSILPSLIILFYLSYKYNEFYTFYIWSPNHSHPIKNLNQKEINTYIKLEKLIDKKLFLNEEIIISNNNHKSKSKILNKLSLILLFRSNYNLISDLLKKFIFRKILNY
jgi:hypothetical protein